jgi:hypothetical protein
MKQIGKPSNSRLMLIPPVVLAIGIIVKYLTTTKVQPVSDIDRPYKKTYSMPPYGSWRQDIRKPKMDTDTNMFKEDSSN